MSTKNLFACANSSCISFLVNFLAILFPFDVAKVQTFSESTKHYRRNFFLRRLLCQYVKERFERVKSVNSFTGSFERCVSRAKPKERFSFLFRPGGEAAGLPPGDRCFLFGRGFRATWVGTVELRGSAPSSYVGRGLRATWVVTFELRGGAVRSLATARAPTGR